MLRRNFIQNSALFGSTVLCSQNIFAFQHSSQNFPAPIKNTFVNWDSGKSHLMAYQRNLSTGKMEVAFSQSVNSKVFHPSLSFSKNISENDIYDFGTNEEDLNLNPIVVVENKSEEGLFGFLIIPNFHTQQFEILCELPTELLDMGTGYFCSIEPLHENYDCTLVFLSESHFYLCSFAKKENQWMINFKEDIQENSIFSNVAGIQFIPKKTGVFRSDALLFKIPNKGHFFYELISDENNIEKYILNAVFSLENGMCFKSNPSFFYTRLTKAEHMQSSNHPVEKLQKNWDYCTTFQYGYDSNEKGLLYRIGFFDFAILSLQKNAPKIVSRFSLKDFSEDKDFRILGFLTSLNEKLQWKKVFLCFFKNDFYFLEFNSSSHQMIRLVPSEQSTTLLFNRLKNDSKARFFISSRAQTSTNVLQDWNEVFLTINEKDENSNLFTYEVRCSYENNKTEGQIELLSNHQKKLTQQTHLKMTAISGNSEVPSESIRRTAYLWWTQSVVIFLISGFPMALEATFLDSYPESSLEWRRRGMSEDDMQDALNRARWFANAVGDPNAKIESGLSVLEESGYDSAIVNLIQSHLELIHEREIFEGQESIAILEYLLVKAPPVDSEEVARIQAELAYDLSSGAVILPTRVRSHLRSLTTIKLAKDLLLPRYQNFVDKLPDLWRQKMVAWAVGWDL